MYTINNNINQGEYKGLNASKLLDINAKEILQITLEKNAILSKHTSPSDAHLILLEGGVSFFINNNEYQISMHQIFNFPKNEEHWVKANENSKFLIIR
jgi:quercetin dioxygenase-like cupin family protein